MINLGSTWKKYLTLISIVILGVGTVLTYPTAKLIMSGDRIMQQFPPGYLGMTMSNKNWLLLITLIVVGGCLGYIAYALTKKRGRFARK